MNSIARTAKSGLNTPGRVPQFLSRRRSASTVARSSWSSKVNRGPGTTELTDRRYEIASFALDRFALKILALMIPALILPALDTLEFRRRPSCGQSCLFRRDRKTATRDDSWCRAERPRYFSSARPRPATVAGSLPPGRERFSSAGRCVRGHGRSETAADIFRAPDRTL